MTRIEGPSGSGIETTKGRAESERSKTIPKKIDRLHQSQNSTLVSNNQGTMELTLNSSS
jgi:hypothetical protein